MVQGAEDQERGDARNASQDPTAGASGDTSGAHTHAGTRWGAPGGQRRAPFRDQVRGVAEQVEEELGYVIAYLNDEVVPQVRRSSTSALRSAASHLAQLAERLERGSHHGPVDDPTAKRDGR